MPTHELRFIQEHKNAPVSTTACITLHGDLIQLIPETINPQRIQMRYEDLVADGVRAIIAVVVFIGRVDECPVLRNKTIADHEQETKCSKCPHEFHRMIMNRWGSEPSTFNV